MLEPGDLVTIDGARNVTLRDFVVSGPLPDTLFCSLELRSGARVKGNGSANILGDGLTSQPPGLCRPDEHDDHHGDDDDHDDDDHHGKKHRGGHHD